MPARLQVAEIELRCMLANRVEYARRTLSRKLLYRGVSYLWENGTPDCVKVARQWQNDSLL